MASKTRFLLGVCVVLLVATTSAWAQTPVINASFEQGLTGWTAYSYQVPPNANPADPITGCIGPSPCQFGLLHPGTAPDGTDACGIQSYETTGNGGVRQSFAWSGGPAAIAVSARAYSERYDGASYNNGCLVRMGLASGVTQDRNSVSWTTFPWSEDWHKRILRVPGSGTYTLFIEASQPNPTAIMSTLWDKVEFFDQPPVLVTGGPSVTNDPAHPDTAVTITWTTDTASTSYVDYGSTSNYGATVGSEAMVTQHSVSVTGLNHSSPYHFRAKSTAAGCVDWISDDLTFQTPIWFSNIVTTLSGDGHGTIVDWVTDVPTTSRVEYWSDVDAHVFTPEITTLTTAHEVTISGLTEGREYSFRVWGRNQPSYSDASSAALQFWTLPPVSQTLENGGFENVAGPQGFGIYPWVQYATQPGTGYHPIDGLVGPYPAGGVTYWLPSRGSSGVYFPGVRAYQGSYFLGAGANAAYKNGGVFQRIAVNPGDFYTLTARYLTHRSGGEDNYNKVRVGIDPNGGVDPTSTSVKWWTGFSDTNDDKWHSTAVTVTAGSSGTATVFLEFRQQYVIEWHVEAIDGVAFDTPFPQSIGALKSSKGSLGAVLEDKIVTYVNPTSVRYEGVSYTKLYVEDENRTAGVAILLPAGSGRPVVGNKLTVTGALGVYDGEAAFVAESWTVDPTIYTLPKPVATPGRSVGGVAQNQPGIPGRSVGACNVGLRVRIFGRITYLTWGSPTADQMVYVDDGSKIADGTKKPDGTPTVGIRAYLYDNYTTELHEGDYVAITGPVTVLKIDPNDWPDGDEYCIYAVPTVSADDWDLLWSGTENLSKGSAFGDKARKTN